MPSLLVINPNTSPSVTARLRDRALALAPPAATVHTATAAFGAAYITGEVSAAIAAHAALDAYAAHTAAHGEPDAVLLGCFGDPGLPALQALAGAPVLGLAEASMRHAASRGRFAIVTGGARWKPMLARLAMHLGLAGELAAIVTVERTGGELAADPPAAHALLRAACLQALQDAPDATCLLLGGAGLAGMAAPLADQLPVPLLDNVDVALAAAWAAATGPGPVPQTASEPGPWHGLSPMLVGRLAGTPIANPRSPKEP